MNQLDKYKDMLSIQHLIFNNTTYQIYGTNEDPLFKCSDILIKLLKYKESSDNRFYKDNKHNQLWIKTRADCLGNKSQKYFTEFGLYRCLFTSQQPLALDFQMEIMQLLQNIRTGIASINIEKVQEYEIQLAEKQQLLSNSDFKVHQLSVRVEFLEQDNSDKTLIIKKATTNLTIYQKESESKKYVGSTQNIKQRNTSHRNNSSNPTLKRCYSEHKEVNTTILKEIPILTADDRKAVERYYIEQIPKEIRMNRVLPQPNYNNVTLKPDQYMDSSEDGETEDSKTEDGETEQSKPEDDESDLDTINETQTEISQFPFIELQSTQIKPKLLITAKQQIDSLKAYLIKNNYQYPNKRSKTEPEHKLGILVDNIRKENKDKKRTQVSEFRLNYVKQTITDFVFDGVNGIFNQSVKRLKRER